MSARRGASGLSGILLVDKPNGCTSHDVINRVRRAAGEKRVGHAGTLDPMATGLLVVLIGPATRLAPYLTAASKSYVASIVFGAATDTDDGEGAIVRTAPVDERLHRPEVARQLLAGLLGDSMQQPPAYSAIKVGGQVAHRAARAGEALALDSRPITVHRAELLGIEERPMLAWDVDFKVSKGTYIRSLARDLGERAGSAAHLAALRRTTSGSLSVADAHSLDEIAEAGAERRLTELFCDPSDALADLPRIHASEKTVMSGRPLPGRVDGGPLYAVYTERESLAALYRPDPEHDRMIPEIVLATPIKSRS